MILLSWSCKPIVGRNWSNSINLVTIKSSFFFPSVHAPQLDVPKVYYWHETESFFGVTSNKIWGYKTDIPHVAQDCELELLIFLLLGTSLLVMEDRKARSQFIMFYVFYWKEANLKFSFHVLETHYIWLDVWNRSNFGPIRAANHLAALLCKRNVGLNQCGVMIMAMRSGV
jgi:hypothetical protein